ncbi:MAG: LysM peptidoglycan-binding domain-containing protein [Verrucomicrobium sp.]|nr:LysM peptidoglycan-binding domain-containing protein [Verrucomicrobium sp.]
MKRLLLIAGLSGLLALGGCQKDDKTLAAEDDTNPYFHAALTAIQERNFTEAARSYEAALRANPNVAQAHYELGLLDSDHLNDPLGAMYHLAQYLKARPTADNAAKAQERLNSAEINFAATLPNSPVQNAQAFAALQSDNQNLRNEFEAANQRINDLSAKLAATQKELAAAAPNITPADTNAPGAAPAPAPAAETAPAAGTPPPPVPATVIPAPVPAPSATVGQTYAIAPGDTLWKIAKKFYPGHINEGIERIKLANAAALPAGKPLKIGAQIVIPAAGAPLPPPAPAIPAADAPPAPEPQPTAP